MLFTPLLLRCRGARLARPCAATTLFSARNAFKGPSAVQFIRNNTLSTKKPSFEAAYAKSQSQNPMELSASFIKNFFIICASVVGLGAGYMGRPYSVEEELFMEKEDLKSGTSDDLFSSFAFRFNQRFASFFEFLFSTEPYAKKLLPDIEMLYGGPGYHKPPTLVIEMNHLLMTPEFTYQYGYRGKLRRGAIEFLKFLSEYYEIVVWTDSSMGATEIVQALDKNQVVSFVLFKDAMRYDKETKAYVKDLKYLNRDLRRVVMVDTDPAKISASPENSVLVKKWEGEEQDDALLDLSDFLQALFFADAKDYRSILKSYAGQDVVDVWRERKRKAAEAAAEAAVAPSHSYSVFKKKWF